MKKFIIAIIASSLALSSASFACSGHKHRHQTNGKPVAEQAKK